MPQNMSLLFKEIDILISAHPEKKLFEVAHRLAVNRQYVERAVLQSTNTTFRQYRAEKIVHQAQQMLNERRDRGIKEISAALGYQSHSAFSRFLKATTGKRPKDMRKEANYKD
jgi:AraC-like DNA-binding protein